MQFENVGLFVRRRAKWFILLVVFLVSVMACWILFRDRRQFAADRIAKIEKGMTKREVIAILGGQPGNYAIKVREYSYRFNMWFDDDSHNPNCVINVWRFDDSMIKIAFDRENKVSSKQCGGCLVLEGRNTLADDLLDQFVGLWLRLFH